MAVFVRNRSTGQRIELLTTVFDDLNLLTRYRLTFRQLAWQHLTPLQRGQNMRHADIREHRIVDPIRTRRIFIETAQVGI